MSTANQEIEKPVRLDVAAAFLGVSVKTARRLMSAGKLRTFKIGGQWFTFMSFIKAYLDSQIHRTEVKGNVSC